ncbi:MAG TPA: methyl-accepting chemotaxis protein, partial [Vicinamibacterales bacterium]|nr:methyl-accepting chemotaxis protein [Vicinamibacterales bacterium]
MKWTLARKIGALAALLVFLPIVEGVYNYRALDNIGGEMSEIVDADLPVTRLVAELNTNGFQEHLAVGRVMRLTGQSGDDRRAERDQAAGDFENLARQFDTRIDSANRAVEQAAKITSEYQRFDIEVHLLQKEQQDFTTVARQVIALSDAGKAVEADRLAPQVEKEASDIDAQASKMVGLIAGFTAESATSETAYETSAKALSMWLGILGTTAALLVSIFFVVGMRRSVGDVTSLAAGISDGNLRQEKIAIRTSDELGQLGHIFNTMLIGLRDNVSQTRQAAESLNTAVVEIVASVKEQAAGTAEQAAAVQETTATMEEISQSGRQIADRSRQVASAAEATSTATAQGLDAAQAGSRVMQAIQEQAETVAENIVTLSEKTQAVGEIIASVTDIAEQSNLLALNAAIEAAAAGEHGRTFAVVANEIKNLADQAKGATSKVRSILGDIQKGINTSVMLTEEVVKRVDSGKRQSDVVER